MRIIADGQYAVGATRSSKGTISPVEIIAQCSRSFRTVGVMPVVDWKGPCPVPARAVTRDVDLMGVSRVANDCAHSDIPVSSGKRLRAQAGTGHGPFQSTS
jgi:hypothetical protein